MITPEQQTAIARWVECLSPHLIQESPLVVRLTAEAGGQAEVRITTDGEVTSTTTGEAVPL